MLHRTTNKTKNEHRQNSILQLLQTKPTQTKKNQKMPNMWKNIHTKNPKTKILHQKMSETSKILPKKRKIGG